MKFKTGSHAEAQRRKEETFILCALAPLRELCISDFELSILSQMPLKLPGVFNRISSPRLGFKPGLADRLAGSLADAEGSVLNFSEGIIQIAEEFAVFFHQAKREFLFVVVGSHVGHVQGKT